MLLSACSAVFTIPAVLNVINVVLSVVCTPRKSSGFLWRPKTKISTKYHREPLESNQEKCHALRNQESTTF